MKLFVLISCSIIVLIFPNNLIAATSTFCDSTQDNFNECLSNVFESALAILIKPIPRFSCPSFSPLNLTNVNVSVNHKYATFEEILHYVAIYNIPTAKVHYIGIDFVKQTFRLDIFFKQMRIKSQYELVGTVLNISTHAKDGYGDFYYDNSTISFRGNFKKYQRGFNSYIKILSNEASWISDAVTAKPVTKTKDDECFNNILRPHFTEITAAFATEFEKVLAQVFKLYLNNALEIIPAEVLFGFC